MLDVWLCPIFTREPAWRAPLRAQAWKEKKLLAGVPAIWPGWKAIWRDSCFSQFISTLVDTSPVERKCWWNHSMSEKSQWQMCDLSRQFFKAWRARLGPSSSFSDVGQKWIPLSINFFSYFWKKSYCDLLFTVLPFNHVLCCDTYQCSFELC
jgi:hypothetical protein